MHYLSSKSLPCLGRSESSDLLILVISAVLLQEMRVMVREHRLARRAGRSSPATCIRDIFRHQSQPFRTGSCSRVIKHNGDSLDSGSLPTNSIFFCSTKDIETSEECFQGKLNDFLQLQGKFSPLIDHGFGGPWNQAFCFHLCPYLFYWPHTTKRSYEISLDSFPNSSLH